MKVHYYPENFHARNPVVTIGFFDGVHKGHRLLLQQIRQVAAHYQGESVVLSFWPHPRKILEQNEQLFLLNSLDEKQRLMAAEKIEYLVIIPFNQQVANMPPDSFMERILVQYLQAKHIIVGYNHHFGNSKKGNYRMLEQGAIRYGFSLEQIDPQKEREVEISSTKIRLALQQGNITLANAMLGYPYMIEGRVIRGKGIGKQLGFPTANIQLSFSDKMLPADGVYCVELRVQNTHYNGVLNIGNNPTLNEACGEKQVEVHILNFSGDIYGQPLQLHILKRLRDEEKFDSTALLCQQISKDIEEAKHFFKNKEAHQ